MGSPAELGTSSTQDRTSVVEQTIASRVVKNSFHNPAREDRMFERGLDRGVSVRSDTEFGAGEKVPRMALLHRPASHSVGGTYIRKWAGPGNSMHIYAYFSCLALLHMIVDGSSLSFS